MVILARMFRGVWLRQARAGGANPERDAWVLPTGIYPGFRLSGGGEVQHVELSLSAENGIKKDFGAVRRYSWMKVASGLSAECKTLIKLAEFDDLARDEVALQ